MLAVHHHTVVHDGDRDITDPGNTCRVSIPLAWDASLAPAGHHAVHTYTLKPPIPGLYRVGGIVRRRVLGAGVGDWGANSLVRAEQT